jgi:DNA-binding CsgD family transcriptional regulator
LGSLTSRERELLNLMADAKSTKEIARELGLSMNTVYVHRRNIMEKLHVKNSAELIKLALRLGVSGRD